MASIEKVLSTTQRRKLSDMRESGSSGKKTSAKNRIHKEFLVEVDQDNSSIIEFAKVVVQIVNQKGQLTLLIRLMSIERAKGWPFHCFCWQP